MLLFEEKKVGNVALQKLINQIFQLKYRNLYSLLSSYVPFFLNETLPLKTRNPRFCRVSIG